MKTIEENIQKDFNICAKEQGIYLHEQQKKRQFSQLDLELKMVFYYIGGLLSIPFLAISKPIFISMNVDYFIWLAYSLSILGISSFFFPRLFFRLTKFLLQMKNKRLERRIIDYFDSEKISDSTHNTIKIMLSMDEYKYFFVNYGESPTYGNIKDFLSERKTFKDKLKSAEEFKLNITLTAQEIAEYQEINLTKQLLNLKV